jgi:predicted TIM-barrel fold metal-dependent hydrolase
VIVDAHVHAFLSAAEDPERTVDEIAPASRRAPVEQLLAVMDAHDVDRAVVLPLGPEDTYVTEALARHPDRLRGVCVDDPDQPVERALSRVVDGGFQGLRAFALPDPDRAAALAAGLVAHDRVLWLYPRAEDLPAVDRLAASHPDLRIALNHSGLVQAGIGVDDTGRPRINSPVPQPTCQAVAALARHPGVVVILSGAYGFSHRPYPYDDVAAHVAPIADAFGTGRLLWASDFPWPLDDPGYARLLALVDHHLPGLSPAERADVLGGACQRFLRWPT